jgi:hypothetical protein
MKWSLPKLRLGWGSLDGNHHIMTRVGWKPCPSCGQTGEVDGDRCYYCYGRLVVGEYEFDTKRSCASIVPLGRDGWVKTEGRRTIGRRLWLYANTGECVRFDISLRFERSPYPAGHKYGPADDGGRGTVML